MSDNESVLSSLSSENREVEEMEMESGAETEPLRGKGGNSEEEEEDSEDGDGHDIDDEIDYGVESGVQHRGTGGSTKNKRSSSNNQVNSLSVPSKRRRLSFDDGSDLSALTSDNEQAEMEMESDEQDEDGEDNNVRDVQEAAGHTTLQDMDLDMNGDLHADANGQDASNSSHNSASSVPMQQSTSNGSSSVDGFSSSSSANNASRKRGKGRPPRRQNALAAAAKRMAIKAGKLQNGNGGGADEAAELEAEEEHEVEESNGESIQDQAQPHDATTSLEDGGEPEEDITSEGERLHAPLPPFPDDSADEDYNEKPQSRVQQKPPFSKRKQSKRPPMSINSLRGRPRSLDKPKQLSAADSPTTDTGAMRSLDNSHDSAHVDFAPPERAQIIVTDASETQQADSDTASIARLDLPAALSSSSSAAAADLVNTAALDTEDAMSGISDDVPILLQATAKAAAAIKASASTSNGNGSSDQDSHLLRDDALLVPSSMQLNGRDATTPDPEAAPTASASASASTSFLPVPSPSIGSRNRARSPNGRGRGRGMARGRGKKIQQQRLLDHDETEVSASGNEESGMGADMEREGSHGLETPAASDHEEGDPVDLNANRKRADAIEALTKIEIEFARIRDILYMEKMEEVAKERWQVEAGIHPELLHLFQLIEHRRRAKLDLAKRVLSKSEDRHQRQAEASHRAVWYDWIDARYELRRVLVDEANVKRRRLDREKRAIERPKNEDLSTILRIHAPPPYMYQEKRSTSAYGNDYSLEFEVAESIQKKRKRGAVGLDQDEALYDLERMGLRDPYHGAYSAHFAFDPAYSQMPGASQPIPFGYDHANQPHQHPLAAQGRTVASVPQHGQAGRPDPFSAYRMQAAGTQAALPHHALPSHLPSNTAFSNKGQLHRPTLDDHLASSPHSQLPSRIPAGAMGFGAGHERTNSRRAYEYSVNGKPEQIRPVPGYYGGIATHAGV